MTDKITIERETAEQAANALLDLPLHTDREVIAEALRAALEAQPAEPVGYVYSDLTGDKPIKNAAIQPHVPNGTLLYAAPPAPAAVPPDERIEKALRRAFDLGQKYWQQADSDYASEHRKSDVTREKFEALVAETIAAGDPRPLTTRHSRLAYFDATPLTFSSVRKPPMPSSPPSV